MKTIRARILDLLQTKGRLSAVELSQALRMTPANARHHLSILINEGVVEVAGQRSPQGRGRPTQLYTLTQQSRRNNLGGLANALLEELLGLLPEEERAAILMRTAERLAGGQPKGGLSLTQRLSQAIHQLNGAHYQARWEAHAEAPYIILGHCPYAEILPDHPELCQLDALLLGTLLGAPVRQTAKLAKDGLGGTFCRFLAAKR